MSMTLDEELRQEVIGLECGRLSLQQRFETKTATKKAITVNLEDIAQTLAKMPTASTKSMDITDRSNGIYQMLCDLNQLARKDGCIAAAWALEFVSHVAEQERAKELAQ